MAPRASTQSRPAGNRTQEQGKRNEKREARREHRLALPRSVPSVSRFPFFVARFYANRERFPTLTELIRQLSCCRAHSIRTGRVQSGLQQERSSPCDFEP